MERGIEAEIAEWRGIDRINRIVEGGRERVDRLVERCILRLVPEIAYIAFLREAESA